MNVLRLITDFIKMSKVWFLSMEFYGVWQEVTCNRSISVNARAANDVMHGLSVIFTDFVS